MKQKCNKCHKVKTKTFSHVYKNKALCKDDFGRIWSGNVCYDCAHQKKPKKVKPAPKLNTTVLVFCKECTQERPRTLIKVYPNGMKVHVDETGARWAGFICGTCTNVKRRKGKPLRHCIYCEKSFQGTNNSQQYCSKECHKKHKQALNPKKEKPIKFTPIRNCVTCSGILKPKQKKYCSDLCQPPRYKKSLKDYPIRQCYTCGTDFKPNSHRQLGCKKTHGPAVRKAKLYRRSVKRCKQQKISKYYKSQIVDIYNKRPEGYHVDHIVPLNGENASGLHVPWNLQYLTELENIKKSNK